MKRSDNINELVAALIKARPDLQLVPADADGQIQNRTFKYATLGKAIDLADAVLAAHGLTVVQPSTVTEDKVIVETFLFHTSGQCISSTMERPHPKDIKEVGMTITYLRRFSYFPILGLGQTGGGEDEEQAADSRPKTEIVYVEDCHGESLAYDLLSEPSSIAAALIEAGRLAAGESDESLLGKDIKRLSKIAVKLPEEDKRRVRETWQGLLDARKARDAETLV